MGARAFAFTAGVGAAGLVLAADFIGRFLLGFLSLPELLLNLVTAALPAPVFGVALVHLRYLGRPLTLVVIAACLLAVGGGGGLLAAAMRRRISARLVAAASALVPAALADALLLGPSGQEPTPVAVIWYSLQAAAFAAALTLMLDSVPRASGDVNRRLFLEYLGLGAAAAVLGTAVLKGLRDLAAEYLTSTPTGRVGPFGVMPAALTPTASFYVVSKNLLGDPQLDGGGWQLRISGQRKRYLGLAELKRLADAEQVQTLECISNEVGGDLMSTAAWRGVRLGSLLGLAGIAGDHRFAIFRAADGYSESLPIDVALDPGTMVALEMNGAPLPRRHGFPARLLVPGRYGMKNIKWLTSIELAATDSDGYWEQRGWSRTAVVKTTSRFDLPAIGGPHRERPVRLGGVAYAGRRGVARVEVSIDGIWTEARLEPPLGPFTWVLWTLDWEPARTGSHGLAVRAVDGDGQVQSAESTPPIPTGATGLHRIVVAVG